MATCAPGPKENANSHVNCHPRETQTFNGGDHHGEITSHKRKSKVSKILQCCSNICERLAVQETTMSQVVDDVAAEQDIPDYELGIIDPDDEKVTINVGGIRHETLISTLVKQDKTRLCRLGKLHIKGRRDEYYFDRHPGVFNSVMDYYRSGELHVPLDVCGAVVKRELDYWQIDDTLIEPCCFTTYSSYIDNQKTLYDFNQSVLQENEELEAIKNMTGWRSKQMVIWMILDHPRSSRLAMLYAVTSFVFVLASITGFCVETLPVMYTKTNETRQCGMDQKNETVLVITTTPYLEYLDYLCTAFFTIELIVRVLFAPNKLAFFRSIMNIIDILALMPLYVQIILDLTDMFTCLKNNRAIIETIFILRIIRIFRIFHLVKHYKALTILVHAIRASVHELLMLSIFLFIATLVFSTLIFYAERPPTLGLPSETDNFGTIPIGFWWSIITMTTVGYGDVHPTSAMGYCIGALCALCGVLLIALTIPVISNNFALFYLHARTREQISTKSKRPSHSDESGESNMKKHSQNSVRRKALDSTRALLSNDSINSTTDESATMVNTRIGVDANSSTATTPAHHRLQNETSVRVPIADIDETVM